jgi:hypothetical protein
MPGAADQRSLLWQALECSEFTTTRTLDPAMVAAASIGCGNSTAAATDEIAAERPEEIGEDRPANRAGHVDDQGNIQTRCRQDECGLC